VKSFPTLFTREKNLKRGAASVWILKCPFPSTGTIYLSGSAFSVASWEGGIVTKSLVADWGNIDENISFGNASPIVSNFSLRLISAQNENPSIETILSTAANNIQTTDCELYLWFIGLNPTTDPPQKMWTGNIVDYRRIDDMIFEVEFSDQSVKGNKVLGNLLNATMYPSIPDRSVGKVAPIIYGSVKRMKPVCIRSGGFTRLSAAITASDTTVPVYSAASFPASYPFDLNIGGEIVSVTNISGSNLTVTRPAYPSCVAHSIDEACVEEGVLTYLVADHPVHAIDSVYIDGEEITDGVTKYTGQSGDEHADYPGKAIIVLEHGLKEEIDVLIPAGVIDYSGAYYTDDAKAIDRDDLTYAYTSTDGAVLFATFSMACKFGRVKHQRANVKLWVSGSNVSIYISIAGATNWGWNMGSGGFFDSWVGPQEGGTYNANVGFYAQSSTAFRVYELRSKEVTYWPYNISGEDAEAVIIGGVVSCDVDGYQDDGSGTHTGTAAALIERPDHIFKHLLYTYLAIATTNFSTDAATPFAADTYKFGIVVDEQKTAKEWFAKMAWECRCYFRFSAGLAQLLYRPDALSSDKTITSVMIEADENGRRLMMVEDSPLREITNKVRARYDKNWSLSGESAYSGLYETSDSTSITRSGEKEDPPLFCFDFITLSAMARDVADFYLARLKDRKKIVTIPLFLDNTEMEFADAITIASLSNLVCEVQKANLQPGSARDMRNDKIQIIAREY
jgi:hypothetical protein